VTQALTRGVAQDRWEEPMVGISEDSPAECAGDLRAKAREGLSNFTKWMSRLVPRLLRVDTVYALGREIWLRETVEARLYWEDGLWTCELANLRVMGYGESQEAAIAAFMEDFLVTYDGLVHEDDASLTEDAKRVKLALKQLALERTPVLATEPGFAGTR
jgi:hypothetical protein